MPSSRLAALWFLLQALSVFAWWCWLTWQPTARPLFLPAGWPGTALMAFAPPDLLVLSVGGAWAGLRLWHGEGRYIATFVTGAVVYATLWCVGATLATGDNWLSLVMMSGSSLGSLLALATTVGNGGFRVARAAAPAHHLLRTGLQVVGFWGLFLFVLPIAVQALGRQLGEGPLGLPGRHWLGGAIFAAASALGLLSAFAMATRGEGTPLPLATARLLVVRGPYRAIRNPMALAGISQGLSVAIWRDSPAVFGYALLGAVAWHCLARPPEERDLLARFGEPYSAYRARTPLWLPWLGPPAVECAAAAALVVAATWLLASSPPGERLARAAPALLLTGLALLLLARQRRR